MTACQTQLLPSSTLLFDIEQLVFQGPSSPVQEPKWCQRSTVDDVWNGNVREADSKRSRQGPILQEDFSLLKDDEAAFSDPYSEENDDDYEMYDVLFGKQVTVERELLDDNLTPPSSEESEQTAHSSKIKLTTEQEEEVSVGVKPGSECDETRLVHLLLVAAEAVEACNLDLASVILERLKELVSYSGSTMQRVTAYFCEGLQCRMECIRPCDWASKHVVSSLDQFLTAFQVFHELSPYTKFGYFTANQAILEAIYGEARVHILDYEIMEGVQWSSLMQSLASRKEGPPQLRVTALYRPHIKNGMDTVQKTGRLLSEFAASLNIPFSFSQIRLDRGEEFRPSTVKTLKGEALVVNCTLHLPHMPRRTDSSVSSFLLGIRQLSPTVVTLVDEELDCSSTSFTSNFVQALRHFSAIFDSLRASFLAQPAARLLVERLFLASRIVSHLICSPSHNSKGQENSLGRRNRCCLMSSAGFMPVPLSAHNRCQARLLQGLYEEGFQIAEGEDYLCLGWYSHPLFTATVWKCR